MAADTVISGVIRGLLPYAAIGAAGFVGYTYLRKKGVFDGVPDVVNTIAETPNKIVETFRKRTGISDFERGDFVGGAQNIVRNIPVVAGAEWAYNQVKDDLPFTLPWEKKEDPPKPEPKPWTPEATTPEGIAAEATIKTAQAIAGVPVAMANAGKLGYTLGKDVFTKFIDVVQGKN